MLKSMQALQWDGWLGEVADGEQSMKTEEMCGMETIKSGESHFQAEASRAAFMISFYCETGKFLEEGSFITQNLGVKKHEAESSSNLQLKFGINSLPVGH